MKIPESDWLLFKGSLADLWQRYEKLREGSAADRKQARRVFLICRSVGIHLTPIGRRHRVRKQKVILHE